MNVPNSLDYNFGEQFSNTYNPELVPSMIDEKTFSNSPSPSSTKKGTETLNKVVPVLGMIQSIKDEKEALKKAQQSAKVSDVMLQASQTRETLPERRYVRPEDVVNSGEEFFPTYGVGTNVLETGGKLPKAQSGAFMTAMGAFGEAGGADLTKGIITDIGGGENAGGNIGGQVGGAIGSIWGPPGQFIGQMAGQALGTILDPNVRKTERANARTAQNVDKMAMNKGFGAINTRNSSYVENGGYVNPEYNPQLITKFGDIDVTDLHNIAHDGMHTLRTGGNLRQNSMDGDLNIYKGGAKTISDNPYSGETVMFQGPSHEEGGMPVSYAGNPVEVEGGEPAMKMENGGDSPLIVYGNLQIPEYGKKMLNDPNAKGKFKNYIAKIAKKEDGENKTIDKSLKLIEDIDLQDPFDKLKFNSLKANFEGAQSKLKEYADVKIKAASLQSALNDTANDLNLDVDMLAKGVIKKAKKGAMIRKAQNGIVTLPETEISSTSQRPTFSQLPYTPPQSPLEEDKRTYFTERGMTPIEQVSTPPSPKEPFEFPWDETMSAINATMPSLRPSDTEALDPRQLLGEMHALSTNQLEPVQAQLYHPELGVPQDISYQDQLNEITAQSRAAERMYAGNPTALADVAAKAYRAKSSILAEQFRANQAQKEKVYGENRAILNQTQLQNLGILDQQYTRQAQAKSATKELTQSALNSISDKYLKNQFENRTLATYENLYNYRFDPKFRATNMNPLAQWNTNIDGVQISNSPGTTLSPQGEEMYPVYDSKGNIKSYILKKETKPSIKKRRNGDIVKRVSKL
jgi:hypothetical protein